VILFLNDIPLDKGGGTRFFAREAVNFLESKGGSKWTADSSFVLDTVNPMAGRVLIFDQSLVHEGIPPASPYFKYIIRSDVMYQRTPSICNTPIDIEAYKIFKQAEELAEAGHVEESLPLFRKAVKMSSTLAAIMGH